MRTSITTFLVSVFAVSVACAAGMQILDGHCTAASHVAEGSIGEDLTKRQSRLFCDSAIVASINGDPRHVMINFGEKRSHTTVPIAYAGVMQDRQMMIVRRVYLQPNQPRDVTEGYCKIFRKQGGVQSIVCGAKLDQGGRRTVPVVGFEVDR